jgi:hypothetical protein
MKKETDRTQWLEQALEDETDIPKPVRRHVKVRNTDKIEVSPKKMTKKVEKKSPVGWILLAIAVLAAVVFAKWKGFI